MRSCDNDGLRSSKCWSSAEETWAPTVGIETKTTSRTSPKTLRKAISTSIACGYFDRGGTEECSLQVCYSRNCVCSAKMHDVRPSKFSRAANSDRPRLGMESVLLPRRSCEHGCAGGNHEDFASSIYRGSGIGVRHRSCSQL